MKKEAVSNELKNAFIKFRINHKLLKIKNY